MGDMSEFRSVLKILNFDISLHTGDFIVDIHAAISKLIADKDLWLIENLLHVNSLMSA